MASGRAMIATDVGGVREAVAGVGVLVPPRNPRAVADACVELLRDPSRRATLAEPGSMSASADCSRSTSCIRRYREIYDSLTAAESLDEISPTLVGSAGVPVVSAARPGSDDRAATTRADCSRMARPRAAPISPPDATARRGTPWSPRSARRQSTPWKSPRASRPAASASGSSRNDTATRTSSRWPKSSGRKVAFRPGPGAPSEQPVARRQRHGPRPRCAVCRSGA